MKRNIFLALVIIISLCKIGNATDRVYNNTNKVYSLPQDTAKLLEDNIIAHKDEFQNKELSVLLNKLPVAVKSYIYTRSRFPGGPVLSIIVSFEGSGQVSDKLRAGIFTPGLLIVFETPIPLGKAWELMHNSKGGWLDAENDYYSKQIVKEISSMKRRVKNNRANPYTLGEKEGKIKIM